MLFRLNPLEEDKIYIKDCKSGDGKRKLTRFFERNFLDNDECSVKRGKWNCIPVSILLDMIDQDDNDEHTMNAFALAIYGLFIFPRIRDHVDVRILDFVIQLNTRINLVPTILTKTIQALNARRMNGAK